MKFRKVINRPIRIDRKGINVAGGVTGVVSANVNEDGSTNVVSRQNVQVVQMRRRNERAANSRKQGGTNE